jgi:hypothetical protein
MNLMVFGLVFGLKRRKKCVKIREKKINSSPSEDVKNVNKIKSQSEYGKKSIKRWSKTARRLKNEMRCEKVMKMCRFR